MAKTSLDSICESKIETLKTDMTSVIDYFDISSIDSQSKAISSYQTINIEEAPSRAKQLVRKNDILVSTVRPGLNAVAVLNLDTPNLQVASTGYCVLRCMPDINHRYIFHFCLSQGFVDNLTAQATGASYPAVSNTTVKNSILTIPNREKQDKIVMILDKAADLISLRKQQLEKLDQLVKSQFIEMFGDPVENSKGWAIRKLSNITTKIGSGATPKGGQENYKNEGISLIRSLNVHNGIFKYENLAYIDNMQAKQLSNVTVEKNDVLINITGASVARSCIVPDEVLPARVNQHVSILRCKADEVSYIYLNQLLTSLSYQRLLLGIGESGGATRQAITKQQLECLEVILPPIKLQNELVNFVQQTDKSKVEIQQSLDKLNILYKSLMQKYFG